MERSMGELDIRHLKLVGEYDSTVDSGRRITLRKNGQIKIFDHYRTYVLEDGTVVLKPRVLVDPEQVVETTTLKMIEESVQNTAQGIRGGVFNPDDFKDLFDEEDS